MSDGHENESDAAGATPGEPDPRPELADAPAGELGDVPAFDIPDAGEPAVSSFAVPDSDLDALLAPPADIAPVDPDALLREAGEPTASTSARATRRRERPAPPMIPKHDPIPTDELAPTSEPSTGAYRVIAGLIFGGLIVLLIAAVIVVIVLATGSSSASGVVPGFVQAAGFATMPPGV